MNRGIGVCMGVDVLVTTGRPPKPSTAARQRGKTRKKEEIKKREGKQIKKKVRLRT